MEVAAICSWFAFTVLLPFFEHARTKKLYHCEAHQMPETFKKKRFSVEAIPLKLPS